MHAIELARDLPVAPECWSDDLIVVLGLAETTDDAVPSAVRRLATGTFRLLREHGARFDEQPELTTYLHDGTLERLLP